MGGNTDIALPIGFSNRFCSILTCVVDTEDAYIASNSAWVNNNTSFHSLIAYSGVVYHFYFYWIAIGY